MEIREDDLRGEAIISFLNEHLEEMYEITPPESVYALDLEGLRVPEISFWSLWDDTELVACGALRELDPHSGEIKSMRTARPHRGKGLASKVLEHIIQEAKNRHYQALYLETGAQPEFAGARALYRRYGFETCGTFGSYAFDPNSTYMRKTLDD